MRSPTRTSPARINARALLRDSRAALPYQQFVGAQLVALPAHRVGTL